MACRRLPIWEGRVEARIVQQAGLRQARLPGLRLASGCSQAIACVTHCWRNAASPMETPTIKGGATAAAVQPPTGWGGFGWIGARECAKAATFRMSVSDMRDVKGRYE